MLSPGTLLGNRYKLDERIAGGGMGDVWRGTDEVLGRIVAIKVLLPALLEEPGFAERFRGEARTMATINHSGVVDIYDYGSEGGTAFLIMEYVEGDALSATLGRVGRLTPARTMALIAQAAEALHAAHEKGIVHRDVKPGNLLVRPNGTLVLTDFGIARSAHVGQLTQAGSVLGTASYLSPEQAAGSGASPLSDVYALGVVAYQCLAGRRPFEGDNPLEVAMRHVRDAPPPLPADIPHDIRQIVERAMAKDPGARFPSAAAFAQAARRASQAASGGGRTAAGPVSGGPTSAPPVSGGPIYASPVSGGPTSAPPVSGGPTPFPAPTSPAPAAPGGTRVMGPMTGVAAAGGSGNGTAPGTPRSGAPGGGFVRGAAAVPPGAATPRVDTGYYPGPHIDPVRPAGGGGRRALIIGASALAVLFLLICGGIGLYRTLDSANRSGSGAVASTSGQATTAAPTSAGAKLIDVNCAAAKGKPSRTVETKLRSLGLKVKEVTEDAGGRRGDVVDVAPCQAAKGDTVTVTVDTGRQPSDATPTVEPTSGGPTGTANPSGSPCGVIGVPIGGTCPSNRN
jgi:serine/threonine-protein kinase